MNKGKRHHRAPKPPGKPLGGHEKSPPRGNLPGVWFYGHHAVAAALTNPRRTVLSLTATRSALDALPEAARAALGRRRLSAEPVDAETINRLFPDSSVHQGIAARVEPLPAGSLEDVPAILNLEAPAIVVALDQVTDPHNVGAIMRSAAAFGAAALLTTDRHAPGESAVLAKAASGALETLPWVRVVNLARALDDLTDHGFWRVGLDGGAKQCLHEIDPGRRVALVLGAEGEGLRHGTQAHCDLMARLPIASAVESLNVSNAAAVALYELARRGD